MPKTVDNYIIKKQLFKDSFEIEYLLCEHKVLRKPFTLKKIQKPSDDCNSKQEEKRRVKLSFVYLCLQNQIQILRQLKSEKVIKCLKILKAKNAVYAVYDEHPDKTLQKIISTEYLTIERKQTILNEIVQLVRQIHEQNIAIGNLEPRNIYFTSDNKILISNFLISKKVQQFESVKVDQFFLENSSKFYAPQLLETGSLSKAADIYSLGQIIKKLKIEKSENQLLSPTKFCYDSIKEIVERMIDENPRLRPSIVEFDKTFGLNRSRNKSTCGSNGSRDNEEKMADVRGLEGCRSQAILKVFSSKADDSTVVHFDSKKALLSKRQTLNNDPVQLKSTKKILLKSRATIQSQFPLQSLHMATLDVPTSIRKSRGVESIRSGKSAGLSSTYNSQSGFMKGSFKEKFQQMMLMRNLVSFLIQMSLFAYGEEGSKQLCYCLIQQAIKYTSDMMKIVQGLMNEETGKKDSFMTFVEECQKEKRKLNEISFFFTSETQNKGREDVNEELKKFGKTILNSYSSDFSTQSKGSQVSDVLSKSKQVIGHLKSKQNEEKLFKTFMVLKRLEYGNYFDFFKAKVHHSNKKFWNEHYFEFEKTFGSKYFAIQIKDLITKK